MSAVTIVHVAVSLVGIVTGSVVLQALIANRQRDHWTAAFLASTILTNATGFLFPFEKFLPSHALAIISLVVLLVAVVARYGRMLAGGWRLTFVISSVFALYVNVFVLVVQLFLKVPSLRTLAPTQTEPVFALTQLLVLGSFLAAGTLAARSYRPNHLPTVASVAA